MAGSSQVATSNLRRRSPIVLTSISNGLSLLHCFRTTTARPASETTRPITSSVGAALLKVSTHPARRSRVVTMVCWLWRVPLTTAAAGVSAGNPWAISFSLTMRALVRPI